jgi:hypothetical protein
MASTIASSASNATGAPYSTPTAAIQAFASSLQTMLTYLIISATLGAILIPLMTALWAFSTPKTRKQPVFVLAMADICIGLAFAIWTIHTQVGVCICSRKIREVT